jgi:hypothetical protein
MSKKKYFSAEDVVDDVQRKRGFAGGKKYLNLPSDVKEFSMKENTREIYLDVIPYEVNDTKHPDRKEGTERAAKGTLWWKRPFQVHKSIGADNATVVCPHSFGKRCPICDWINTQLKTGTKQWDDVKEIASKDRALYAVIPIGSEDHDEIVHIWDMADHLFLATLKDELKSRPEMGIFPDISEGRTLKIKFRWKSFGKKSKGSWPEASDIDFMKREPYDDSILDEVPNLDSLLVVLSSEELEMMFLELDEEDRADVETKTHSDDVDESPRRRRVAEEEKTEAEEPPIRRRKVSDEKEESPVSRRNTESEERPTTRRRDMTEDAPVRRTSRSAVAVEAEEKPVTRASRNVAKEDKDEKEKCPYGHVFGVDIDKFKDCGSCNLWDDCNDAEMRNRNKK